MIKIILINGKAGSGKDTFAQFLKKNLKLKGIPSLIISNASYIKNIAKHIFNWDENKDYKGRKLLIDLAETGYNYDPYFWEKKTEEIFLKYLKDRMASEKDVYIIIPDFRYENTYKYFKRYYPVFGVKIYRENAGTNTSLDEDKSENMINVDYFRFIIYNDGTLENLEKNAIYFIEKILGE